MSRRASGWAGEKVARNRDHSRPLGPSVSCPPPGGTKGEGGMLRMTSVLPERARSECARSMGEVEVTLTIPLLFWPLSKLGERGLSDRLTNDH